MSPTVPDLHRKQAWKEVALHPPLSAEPAGGWPYRDGSGTGGAPAATPLPTNALYASRRRLRAWPGGGMVGQSTVAPGRFDPGTAVSLEGPAEIRPLLCSTYLEHVSACKSLQGSRSWYEQLTSSWSVSLPDMANSFACP